MGRLPKKTPVGDDILKAKIYIIGCRLIGANTRIDHCLQCSNLKDYGLPTEGGVKAGEMGWVQCGYLGKTPAPTKEQWED